MKMTPRLQKVLDELEVPWTIVRGTRHRKLYIDGVFAAILPHGKLKDADARSELNTISQIRHAMRGRSTIRRTQK